MLALFLILFVWWWFCLPKVLFNSPTSTVLLDRSGQLLNAQIAEDGQWRFPPTDSVPEKFKKAIIEFEDRTYYSHIGISVRGVARAMKQNIENGKIVSGGSTLSMQVIRMSRKKPRTIGQKVIEMIWATRLEARFTKEEILALYASNAPMGGNVVGLEAAAWRYFQRSPFNLSWAETATLAVLPNAPSLIHLGKNRDKLRLKRNRLLKRLLVSQVIDNEIYSIALSEPIPESPLPLPQLAIHLMNNTINAGGEGKKTNSTINKNLQSQIIDIVDIHHKRLKANNIFNGAVIVGNIKTGKIEAYIGNTAVKEREHGGSVDIISAPRSSGSILKPFLYAFMLEDGYISPNQVIYDVPTSMAGYSPENYNQKYAGIVPASEALSKSLNVPFVRMLRDYGIQKFHSKLTKLGMSTLTKPASHYGLSLILGGCEVKLIDLVNMYAKMGRSVSQYPNYDSLTNSTFTLINQIKPVSVESGISAAAAYVTLDAMQKVIRPNKEKNWQEFETSQQIAWKTGTSYGFRDAWAVGLNQDYVVGVWVGNADGEGRPGIVGVEAAAPLMFDVFSILSKSEWFVPPLDEIEFAEICKQSGMIANSNCTDKLKGKVPTTVTSNLPCIYHKLIFVNKTKTLRLSSNCSSINEMKKVSWFYLPPKVAYYYQQRTPDYLPIPPFRKGCIEKEELPQISIIYPTPDSKIVIPKREDENSKIIFEVVHREGNHTLYWHLNEEYVGETSDIHQIEISINVGKHILTVMDELGNSEKTVFQVVKD